MYAKDLEQEITVQDMKEYDVSLELKKAQSAKRRKMAQRKATEKARVKHMMNAEKYVSVLIPIKDTELLKKFAAKLRENWKAEGIAPGYMFDKDK